MLSLSLLNLPTPTIQNLMHDLTFRAEFNFFIKILCAFLLGGGIGWEREKVGKEAGIRTFGLICMGSCAFSIVSQLLPFADQSRIAAQIVLGIGFIGGGLIFNDHQKVYGLTTAASLWVTASIGISIGFGLFFLALGIFGLTIVSLHLPSARFWGSVSKKRSKKI